MLIAVTSLQNTGLESPVASHFGHAPFFTLLDIDEKFNIMEVKVLENQMTGENHKPGMVPKMLMNQGVNMLITGALGQRAFEMFNSNNIAVVPNAMDITVKTAYDEYLAGNLKAHGTYGTETHHNVSHLHPEHHN
jgi:predicted Fe-Mo cluster-binding NifX family protein